MLTRFFRSIASLALVAGIAVATTPTTARAVTVDFTTTGAFSGTGASGNVLSVGGVTITFTGRQASAPALGTPSSTSFGDFTVTGLTTSSASFSNSFTLTIAQTLPSAGGASFPPASVTGTISFTGGIGSSDAVLQFASPLTQTIGGIVAYKIANADDGTPGKINLPAGGMATINGQITAVPEPATLLSMAVGLPLLGLGAWARRRRQSS